MKTIIREAAKLLYKYDGISVKSFPITSKIIFERIMKVIKVIRVLMRILTDSDIIDLYGMYCDFYKNIQ